MYNPLPLIWRHAKRTRLRWALGTLGLGIAVGLLTIANIGIDSFARSYLDMLTLGMGRADAHVTIDTRGGSVPWYDGTAVADQIAEMSGVHAASPRVQWPVRINRVNAEGENNNANVTGEVGGGHRWGRRRRRVSMIGLDLQREQAAGSETFGVFLDATTQDAPVLLADVTLLADECLISTALAERLDLQKPGVRVRVQLEGVSKEFSVKHIVRQRGVVAGGERHAWLVVRRESAVELMREVVDTMLPVILAAPEGLLETDRARQLLRALYANLGDEVGYDAAVLAKEGVSLMDFHREHGHRLGEVWQKRRTEIDFTTNIVVAFADRHEIYDAGDVPGTVRRLRDAGEVVQTSLGSDFRVQLLKARALLQFESQTPLFRGIFWLFGVLALSISALLIYSLISVNVEERVRESAILRTLGAYRRHIFTLVLVETMLMVSVALVLGLGGGVAVFHIGVAVFNNYLAGQGWDMAFSPVVSAGTLALIVIAGLAVGALAGIIPARRATMPTIVEALRPARLVSSSGGRSTERRVDLRLTFIGATLFILGLVVYYTITLVAIRRDLGLLAWGSTALLLLMLIGFVLLALGVQPWFERGLVTLLRPYLGVTATFTQRNLGRYRRRNTTTAVIFALSVSLVMFLASIATTVAKLGETAIHHRMGSDVKIWAEGEDPETFVTSLEELEGVEAASRISISRDYGEVTNNLRDEVEISDVVGLRRSEVELHGTDGRLLEAIDTTHLAMAEGDRNAFDRVDASKPNEAIGAIIICQALSSDLDLHLGDRLRLTSRVGDRRLEREFHVVGVVRRLPGLDDFRIAPAFADDSGVLVSQAEFDRLMFADTKEYADAAITQWRSETFVRTTPGATDVERRIRERFSDDANVRLRVHAMAEQLDDLATFRLASEAMLTGVLLFASVIAVFALIASMYATVLERKTEIGVLKALGMRPRMLFRMFAGESITLLLASGGIGAVTGFVLAYLLVSVQELASEIPTPFAVPMLPTLGLIVLSIGVGVLAAWLPLRGIVRRPVAAILGRTE